MNAKDLQIHYVQQESLWLTIAKKIVRHHARMLREQQHLSTPNQGGPYAEVCNRGEVSEVAGA